MSLLTDFSLHREIARCNALPVMFDGFLNTAAMELSDGILALDCVNRRPANTFKGHAPSYHFAIIAGGIRAGNISLRVGYTKSLFYAGQIGYSVYEPHRGNGYAGRACRLLIPLMRAHGMQKVLITNNPDNAASRRVCEKLGARLVCMVKLPWMHELYRAGDRYKNIFEWDIGI